MMSDFRRVVGILVVASSFGVVAENAEAIIAVEGALGHRTTQFECTGCPSKSVTSNEVNGGVFLDPIPLIPISFGLDFSLMKWQFDSKEFGVSEATGYLIGPQIKVWVPLPVDIKPYGRVGYEIGRYVATGKNSGVEYAQTVQLSGPLLGVGVKWELLPLTAPFFEIQYAPLNGKISEQKVGGRKVSGGDNTYSVKSTGFLLGVEVGI